MKTRSYICSTIICLAASLAFQGMAADLPKVLFFANPMASDNDVIRRAAKDELSVAERHFAALSEGVFAVTFTQDGKEIARERLVDYRALVFFTALNPPGVDLEALVGWVADGGAFVGIHSTANSFQNHAGFKRMLGGDFDRRPWRTPQAPRTRAIVRVNADAAKHPATKGLPERFPIVDDLYQFKNLDRASIQILLNLDPAGIDLKNPKVNAADRDWAISWVKPHGEGRVFYTALGDGEESWKDPVYRAHLTQGILWAMKADETAKGKR